jgi:cobalt-zinc-cadmium efflux system membrane fusion protein
MVMSITAAGCKEAPPLLDGGKSPGAPLVPPGRTHEPDGSASKHGASAGFILLDDDAIRDLRLRTSKARRRTLTHEISAFGEMQLDEDATVDVVSPLRATVLRIAVRLGRAVRKGDPVAVLRSADLAAARADVLSAQARLRAAERAHGRVAIVAAEGLAAKRDEETARAELERARLLLRAAQTKLAAFGVGLTLPSSPDEAARFTLRAPRAGLILNRPVVLGAMLEAGRLVARIVDEARVVLVTNVYEREVPRLRLNGAVHVALPAFPGKRFEGRIAVLTGVVDPNTRTSPVRVRVANPEKILRPGMAATATFDSAEDAPPVLVIPVAAAQRVKGTWSVFLPRGQGRFERRDVARGREVGGEVEILRGLREGEEVVVEGAFLLASEAARAPGHEEHH